MQHYKLLVAKQDRVIKEVKGQLEKMEKVVTKAELSERRMRTQLSESRRQGEESDVVLARVLTDVRAKGMTIGYVSEKTAKRLKKHEAATPQQSVQSVRDLSSLAELSAAEDSAATQEVPGFWF